MAAKTGPKDSSPRLLPLPVGLRSKPACDQDGPQDGHKNAMTDSIATNGAAMGLEAVMIWNSPIKHQKR